MAESTGKTRPGGRTQRTRAAVHAATRELLAEKGGGLPSLAEVADRSGVHLATIYRRWHSVQAVVLDAAVDDLDETSPIAVTGDLGADLLAYARALAAGVAAPGGLGFLRTLIDAASDPDTQNTELLAGRRLDRFQEILDAGGATLMTPIDIVDNLLAPIYLRALLLEPIDPDGTDPVRLTNNLMAINEARLRESR